MSRTSPVCWTCTGRSPASPPTSRRPAARLLFEVLEDGAGRRLVRTSYRSQTLDQIRDLAAGPAEQAMTTPSGCPDDLCPVDAISTALTPASRRHDTSTQSSVRWTALRHPA